ncbi:hypothetical protein EV383_6141 [Pseudonocardia sediminis]|uniref:Uncharacterized protein n=1 Tax=Pseudonocardia sediminis TaxID=1397368 RepID=A0A4Q7V3J1_PSEST|nr:hypothetical protein [Pseudonocardia sediminis]RZT89182.1 hypothetical protein EV383_6141 [Pseudonocardia sediminis]
MVGTGGYIALIIVGIVITVGVGQILYRSGEPFLEEVFQNKDTARSLNRLLVLLFHLLTLGVLAMISIVDIPSGTSGLQAIVFKTGVVLLIVGIAYGVSMLVLLRVRERRRQAALSDAIDQSLAEQRQGRAPGRIRRGGSGPGEGQAQSPSGE